MNRVFLRRCTSPRLVSFTSDSPNVDSDKTAHPSNRGRLTATFQLFIGIGAFVAGWIGYGCSQAQPGTALEWRVPVSLAPLAKARYILIAKLALQMTPAIPLVFLTFLLPESPRWLMIQGREEDALRTLARLHARGNMNDAFVRGEFDLMRAKVLEEKSMDQSWSLVSPCEPDTLQADVVDFQQSHQSPQGLLRYHSAILGPDDWRFCHPILCSVSASRTAVSWSRLINSQVYTSVGFIKDALLINSINNVIGILGQVACVLFLDRIGRRMPLIGGNIISGICFMICTYVSVVSGERDTGGTDLAVRWPSSSTTAVATSRKVSPLSPSSTSTTFSSLPALVPFLGSSKSLAPPSCGGS